jgi:short-subunit dehydrogenase
MALPPPAPDSTALVTGASSGIGTELARGLARRGHGVVLVARREEALERLASELREAHGVRAESIACDLTDPAARDRLAARVDELGLTVEILVNNAGFGTYVPFHTSPREREVDMVRTNVEAVVDLTGRYLPAMVERRRGAILCTASTASYQPLPRNATYSASKAFVLSLVQSLHEEVKEHGVTVTALCPGPVRTPFQEASGVEQDVVPDWFWSAADDVAEAGLVGLDKGRREVVPGAFNKVGAVASQVTPNAVLVPLLGHATRRVLGH